MALIEGQLAFLILSSYPLLLAVGVRCYLPLCYLPLPDPAAAGAAGAGDFNSLVVDVGLENWLLGESALSLSLVLASYGFLILRHGDLVGIRTILCSCGDSFRMLKSGQISYF